MAEGYGAPKKGYYGLRERSQSLELVSFLSRVTLEKDEERSPKKPVTKAKKHSKPLLNFQRSCAKYVPTLEKEKALIDITALRREKGSTLPIPLEFDVKCKQECVPIVYDAGYNIDTTRAQLPLPSQPMMLDKPAQVFSMIKGEQFQTVKAADIASIYDISNYVSPPIRQLQVGKIAEMMMLKLSSTITWKDFSSVVLRPLRYQVMGSVLACKLALVKGWAINIGGGFSHYTTNTGGGLAVYDDVLMCLAIISNLPEVKHIMVVNVDAYQSPCYKYAQNINCPVTVVDMYSEPIPETHDTSEPSEHVQYHDYRISVGHDVPTSSMYSTMRDISKYLCDEEFLRPSLCIYVTGSSVLAENPHTKMQFTLKHLLRRDGEMFKVFKEDYKIPIAFLMGGGYQPYDVEASAAVIRQILTRQGCTSRTKKIGRIK